MKKFISLLILIFLFLPSFVFSTTINNVSNYNVYKNQLAGMQVFIDSTGNGFDSEYTWSYDNGFSGVDGNGWDIKFTGNYTGDSGLNWILTSTITPIYKIKINAYRANNFFDIVFDNSGEEYTPGSDQGLWYPNDPYYNNGISKKNSEGTVNNSYSFYNDQGSVDYYWKFTDPVLIKGDHNSPYGDLYTTLEMDFLNPLSQQIFKFGVDTDTTVPEPSTLFLLGSGILGLFIIKRK